MSSPQPNPRPLRVLFIDGVGPFGGASRSLFEAIRALPEGSVEARFVAADGTAVDFYRKVAADVITTRGLTRFDNTRYSHYRGVRWLVLLRELFHFPFTLAALYRARRRWGDVDLIHGNEITEIIPLLIAKRVFGAPAMVHVRSMQRVAPNSYRTRWFESKLRTELSAVVAIDENVRSTLPPDIAVDVIHNSFTPKADAHPDPALLERLAALRPSSLKVGFVGNLHLGKGLLDLLEAARLVVSQGWDVEFLVVGGETRNDQGLVRRILATAGLAQNVDEILGAKIEEYKLGNHFHLLGPTKDIQRVYERLDVLSFPSHFDAIGRPVFEAAFSGVPAVACISDPRPDTMAPNETGLAVSARNPKALAEAIIYFAGDRQEVRRMGENARRLAITNFDPAKNSRKLLDVYRRIGGKE
jgi:glycosyltransferase involved in cell wall biosynthesis